MNRSQALKKAVQLFGKKAAVEDTRNPSSQTARDAAFERRKHLIATLTPEERKARRRELINLFGESDRYRFSVGIVSTMAGFSCFHTYGRGDTWDEAFTKAAPFIRAA